MAKAPNEITGLAEWWDPDDVSGVDGDSISTWTGKNGIAFTAPTGDEPILVGAARSPSALQMVRFDLDAQRMLANHASLNNGQTTILTVHHPLSLGSGRWLFNKVNTDIQSYSLRQDDSIGMAYRAGLRLDGSESTFRSAVASSYVQETKPIVLIYRYDGTALTLRANGVEIASLTVSGAIDTDNPGDLSLGNHPTTDSFALDSMIGDFAVFDNAISLADVAELEAWASARWNVADYWDTWTTGSDTVAATPGAGEGRLGSPCIRELDVNTWIMFAAVPEASPPADRWIDYWTAPKSDPHNWTRNVGGPIIDADVDSPTSCRAVSAIKDGSTWHILVDSAPSFYHFSGTDLSALTDNGLVFSGQGTGWEQFVRHPYISQTKVGAAWPVYYDGRQGTFGSAVGAIGVVYTEDFVTFSSRQQVLDVSSMWWETTDVGAPAVQFRDGRWEMVYAGFDEDLLVIGFPHYFGLALSADGTTWTKISERVPIMGMARGSIRGEAINTPELFDDGTNLWIYFLAQAGTGLYRVQTGAAYLAASLFDPANLVASVVGDDVTLTWDA